MDWILCHRDLHVTEKATAPPMLRTLLHPREWCDRRLFNDMKLAMKE